jgi:hypothetical protein
MFCPKCYEPVYFNGTANSGKNLMAQYHHRVSQKLECNYNGSAPIGAVEAKRVGVPEKDSKAKKRELVDARGEHVRYVITSAQNATDVYAPALRSLETFCRVNRAKLLVIPYRYKNPTSIWSQKAKNDDWWDAELVKKKYIMGERVVLSKYLIVLGDIMTQPTATRPLEGFETISGTQSAIIGHPKLELQTIPTPHEKLPKILTTTGAITKRNYIPSRAGKKGEFHHTFGACYVELDGDTFFMRQLNMKNDGSFCDLLKEYDGDDVRSYARVPGLVMGDTHVNVIDPKVDAATFTARDSIVKVLKPEALVWHDVHDGTAKNHHDRGRAFHEYVKHRVGQDNVRAELEQTFEFIDSRTPLDTLNVIVPSNHNDFVKEWIENTDWRRDPENARVYLQTALGMLDSPQTAWTPAGVTVQDAFAYWGARMLGPSAARTTFLRRDQSHLIKGIEVGFHGDRGPGGQKGSRDAFRKVGAKTIIGHAHAPGIMDGCYQVGTSSFLNLTYASGSPSAWLNTHAVIYPNGKRSLIHVIDGRWRA